MNDRDALADENVHLGAVGERHPVHAEVISRAEVRVVDQRRNVRYARVLNIELAQILQPLQRRQVDQTRVHLHVQRYQAGHGARKSDVRQLAVGQQQSMQ